MGARAGTAGGPPSSSAVPAPCVLVVTDDFDNMVEVRVRIPFDALYRAGLIRGYHVLLRGKMVRSVGIPEDIEMIDVVWVQRVPARNFLFVADALKGRFVYDIDDNFLATPSYHASFSDTVTGIVRHLLRESKVVSVSSDRLITRLETQAKLKLAYRSYVTPNMAEEVRGVPKAGPPTTLLLAASGNLPLTASRESFTHAVRRFVVRHDLSVVYVGNMVNDMSALGPNVYATGMLDYFTYREFIRRQNALAIVPLEGRGDEATRDFIESKSDIKMVEFGSCGLSGVYADVGPFRESPLRGGPLVDMGDPAALEGALETAFNRHQRVGFKALSSVRKHRFALTCVPHTWMRAVEAGQLRSPVQLQSLLERERTYASAALAPDDQLSMVGQADRIAYLLDETSAPTADLFDTIPEQFSAPIASPRPRKGVIGRTKYGLRILMLRAYFALPVSPGVKSYMRKAALALRELVRRRRL